MQHLRGRAFREKRTVAAMISMYCRGRHGSRKELCPTCADLLAYARRRVDGCPFGEEKPTCANCPIHCYRADMRQRIREVMRYSGPRMLLRHPVLAFLHLIDGRRHVSGAWQTFRTRPDCGKGTPQDERSDTGGTPG